jgi:hypothetical protein
MPAIPSEGFCSLIWSVIRRFGQVRYDALEPAPVLGQVWSNIDDSYFWLHQFFRRIDSTDRSQVDLQLRLTPTVARAIERERQACVEAGAPDGTCFLWVGPTVECF